MGEQYTEPTTGFDSKTLDYSKALKSFGEELEAINFYQQRLATATNPELSAIMAHNRNEEIEHAVMLCEWMRRNMPGWDEAMKTYLFTTDSITSIESAGGEASGAESGTGIGIGKLS
jgi:ferritin-like protein